MIEANTKRKRTKTDRKAVPSQAWILHDDYGSPLSEDAGYVAKELTWSHPEPSQSSLDIVTTMNDAPGTFRYQGDPISKVETQLDKLRAGLRESYKRAREQARQDATRVVKLRRKKKVRVRDSAPTLYFGPQGDARYRYGYHFEERWEYRTVTRVEPIRYRMVLGQLIETIRYNYSVTRASLKDQIKRLKGQRLRELKQVLRPGSGYVDAAVIPYSRLSDRASPYIPRCATPAIVSLANYDGNMYSWYNQEFKYPLSTNIGFEPFSSWITYYQGTNWPASTCRGVPAYLWGVFPTATGAVAETHRLSLSGLSSIVLPDKTPRLIPELQVDSELDTQEIDARLLQMKMSVFNGHMSTRDRQFVLARSIGELKDLPETVKQGLKFLGFLAQIPKLLKTQRGSLASRLAGLINLRSSLREVAGWWLAYKFAIKPTIDDVKYVVECGFAAASEIRRQLSSLSSDLRDDIVNITQAQHYSEGSVRLGTRANSSSDPIMLSRRFRVTHHAAWLLRTGGYREGSLHNWTENQILSYLRFNDLKQASEADGASVFQVNQAAANAYLGADLWPQLTNSPFLTIADEESHQSQTFTLSEVWRNGGESWLNNQIAAFVANRVYDPVDGEVIHLPLRLKQRSRLAFTGQFALAELRRVLNGGLDPLHLVLDKLELMSTAWELAPLSFVIDWFATTQRSVSILNDWVSRQYNGLEAIDACASVHVDLFAHQPEVVDDFVIHDVQLAAAKPMYFPWEDERSGQRLLLGFLGGRHEDDINYRCMWDACSSIEHTFTGSVRYRAFAGPLMKTGMSRWIRGPFSMGIADSIIASLPRLRISLNASKVSTLVAMFGFR